MNVVLPPLNEVIDLHTTHLSAARRHIPNAIMASLLAGAVISLALLGFGNGQVGRRFPILNSVYGLTLVIALWMTIDLDHLRGGAIQVSVQPLLETLASFKS
jgi:Na+/citrate or Na+/malate symporter